MKLYRFDYSPYARKVRIVLNEKRMDCELELVDVTQTDHAAIRYNPLGKVPVLLLDDGTPLFDSRVIVEFLDNISPISRLIPDDHRKRIAVRRWEAKNPAYRKNAISSIRAKTRFSDDASSLLPVVT